MASRRVIPAAEVQISIVTAILAWAEDLYRV
jgi:hypothetical protein